MIYERVHGSIEALSPTEAASDWEYRLAEKDALLRLAQKARDIGANAVVVIRKANAHYDQAGGAVARIEGDVLWDGGYSRELNKFAVRKAHRTKHSRYCLPGSSYS